jgi:hypothetical protein
VLPPATLIKASTAAIPINKRIVAVLSGVVMH